MINDIQERVRLNAVENPRITTDETKLLTNTTNPVGVIIEEEGQPKTIQPYLTPHQNHFGFTGLMELYSWLAKREDKLVKISSPNSIYTDEVNESDVVVCALHRIRDYYQKDNLPLESITSLGGLDLLVKRFRVEAEADTIQSIKQYISDYLAREPKKYTPHEIRDLFGGFSRIPAEEESPKFRKKFELGVLRETPMREPRSKGERYLLDDLEEERSRSGIRVSEKLGPLKFN
nr:hypothetical protein [Nanoarchaeum sp.]